MVVFCYRLELTFTVLDAGLLTIIPAIAPARRELRKVEQKECEDAQAASFCGDEGSLQLHKRADS